ncbi:MAG: hypothetical protein ABIY55_09370 [Kofleriaceae bacterium]
MTQHEMAQVMDFLFAQRVDGLPPAALAEVFDRLIWCLVDNGGALLEVRESWLTSDDKARVEIALAMDETYPFNKLEKMDSVFAKIATKWPDLASRCEKIAAARRAQSPGQHGPA